AEDTEGEPVETLGALGIDEKLLYDTFSAFGVILQTPKIMRDPDTGYGFVEFLSEEDADYAIKIMNMIKLYGKPIRVNKASAHNKNLDVGANIFIGNLDPEIDEKLLYDTFSAFGVILCGRRGHGKEGTWEGSNIEEDGRS
uniref:Splicing factor 3b subunit 4 n=1 Tax=Malurus cyaneus samueli TaxID=2593467 RepID=A0A8C5TIX9_9PASS